METTADGVVEGMLVQGGVIIRPPRLEHAGLENCALPPDSIREAFSRAATALKSRILPNSGDKEDGNFGCVPDPGPTNGERSDELVAGEDSKISCGAGEKGLVDSAEDRVVVVGGDGILGLEKNDVVIGGKELREGEGKGKSCVLDGEDGLQGFDKKVSEDIEDEDGVSEEKEHPLLVEDLA